MDESLDRKYLNEELYEKIVSRKRKRKLILVVVAFSLFLFLCGIPIYEERLPKWKSLKAARRISVALEKLKTESIQLKKPLQLQLIEDGTFKVEQVARCLGVNEEPEVQSVLHLRNWNNAIEDISLMNAVEAKKLNMNFVIQKICFDPTIGLGSFKGKKVVALVPVKDLAESRLDRASYIEIDTAFLKISIN